jgi:hypothetical protein
MPVKGKKLTSKSKKKPSSESKSKPLVRMVQSLEDYVRINISVGKGETLKVARLWKNGDRTFFRCNVWKELGHGQSLVQNHTISKSYFVSVDEVNESERVFTIHD